MFPGRAPSTLHTSFATSNSGQVNEYEGLIAAVKAISISPVLQASRKGSAEACHVVQAGDEAWYRIPDHVGLGD